MHTPTSVVDDAQNMNREKTTCCCWWWRDVEYRPATIQIIFKAQKSHTKFYIQIRTYSPISPASFFSLFYHSVYPAVVCRLARAFFLIQRRVVCILWFIFFRCLDLCVCASIFFSLVVSLVTKNQMEKEYFIEQNVLFFVCYRPLLLCQIAVLILCLQSKCTVEWIIERA